MSPIFFFFWQCWWFLCRILVWGDGYYNGAIKTRKTVQPMEVSAEEASLQRSQQLRELYESLSAGETGQPARRPCAALSPEDLTESEWFYLMCVSFSFPAGVGYVCLSLTISSVPLILYCSMSFACVCVFLFSFLP